MLWKKVIIALAIIVVLLVISYMVLSQTASSMPLSKVCSGGAYSDGSQIVVGDAQLGSVVCGGGNRLFTCMPGGGWALGSGTCSPGMRGMV